jgi:DNA topoisomerase VI subunit A
VFVPRGWDIHIRVVDSIASFLEDGEEGADVFVDKLWGGDNQIRPLISSLNVNRRKSATTKIRAVIVVEHKNIQYILNTVARRQDPRFAGLLYVLTGGFSDLPTREFLHMLSKDKQLQDAEFLFISDRDAHAMEIFADIKYGSRNSSYCSLIATCPQLQWAGLAS